MRLEGRSGRIDEVNYGSKYVLVVVLMPAAIVERQAESETIWKE